MLFRSAYIEMSGPDKLEKDDAALDARFAAMETDQDIEEQLGKLKQQVGGKKTADKGSS